MSSPIRNLKPANLWNRFADLNSIPRPSKHEEAVCAWLIEWAGEKGLEVMQDDVENIIMRKPATTGMEGRQTVVLQSHVDMVCQKNNDTEFDFMTEGIKMYVDGDWVRAEGTTLGADNGIGVASILAVLESSDIPHPPLEALFTIDEETGMTGALGLKGELLDATILLNLDTEDDDEISIGCAGGVDLTSTGTYEPEATVTENTTSFKLVVKGGNGGHSGMDIHKGIANANKLLNRVLLEALESVDLRISAISGGGLRNAIPREAEATIIVSCNDLTELQNALNATTADLKAEYNTTDSGLDIRLNNVETPSHALPEDVQNALLLAIQACPVGIHRMSPDIAGLVQTSNNLARVQVEGGTVNIQCLNRSSVDSEKWDHARSIEAAFSLAGLTTERGGAYPGWTPNPSSAAVEMLRALYVERYNEQPKVMACHAGLECGILGTNYPDMDMASFGPNIRGAHSPDECVQISSVDKFWGFFLEALKRTPERA
jgi:dipeptidase D